MNQYFSHRTGGNQRREIVNQITGAVVATYETGNQASRDAALSTAAASNGATLTALVNGGKIIANREYTLADLQRLFAALED